MKKLMLLPAALTALAFVPSAGAEDYAVVGCNDQVATIVGTSGPDTLTGTPGRDIIAGRGGNDIINGGGGNDLICGGGGDDTIQGQAGNDRIYGDAGEDHLDGGEGGCCPAGPNTGDDVLWGGPDNDELHSSDHWVENPNRLFGEGGNDVLWLWSGGRGEGGEGNDTVNQYSLDATLVGGDGSDTLIDHNDYGFAFETVTLLGNAGNDTLISQDATSTAHANGGGGTDSCTGEDTSLNCES